MVPVIRLYGLLATLLSPLIWLLVRLHPRLRAHATERLGAPELEVNPGAIWIHAASLGEGRAAQALIPALRLAAPGEGILRTCTSDNAREQRIGADQTLCAPIDVPVAVGEWLDRVRPRCLLLIEAELWPSLLEGCRRRRIPIVVIGARVGRGTHRLRRVPFLWRALTRGVRFLPADAAAAAVYGGAPVGELKHEAPAPAAPLAWTRPAVLGACTHPGDEEALLRAVRRLDPRPLLILAPRDPRRFAAVGALLESRDESFVRRSALTRPVPETVDVVLLDTLGELAALYHRATAAFVGGTFDPAVGGHSPAEGQAAGCPLLHGPHIHAHAAAWALRPSAAAESPARLAEAIAEAMGAARPEPVGGAVAGVTVAQQVVAAILPEISTAPAPERPVRPWLYPFVPLWFLGLMLRPRPLRPAPVPVVSVGALTAGGSGKTPVARWFAEQLADCDPVVVSRGYGRRKGEEVRLDGEAAELGDELVMLRRRGIRVASAPDRMAGIEAAVKAGARLAVLDDALQYGDVGRNLEVVVVDARWPRGGGPIPVGTARVPVSWLAKADVVWVNHGAFPESLRPHVRPDATIVEARYRPSGWLFRGNRLPLSAIPRLPGAAFAGIARPTGFFQLVRSLGIELDRTWVFPDHHPYVWGDLQSIEAWLDDHVVVTTEKDAARLPSTVSAYALLVDLEITRGAEALEARLAALRARVAPR